MSGRPVTRTVWQRVRSLFGSTPDRVAEKSEQDAGSDSGLVSSRAVGGRYEVLSGDRGSVTGTGDTDTFVGQVAGDDLGYAGETGAERRAEAAHEQEDAPDASDAGPQPPGPARD